MKISCNALKKYIKNSNDIDWLNIWNTFTIRTAEVEGVEEKGFDIDGVVIGQIKTCENHPKSTKLHILTVDIGKEELQIVCGAPNVKENMKVALIQIGGHIEGITIGKRPLVGVDSYGMCCSEAELGLSDDATGIMEIPDDWEIGKDIKYYIPEMEDIIVEIDNKSLTNRPDLWGHYGIAREIAAITKHELLPLDLLEIPNNKKDLNVTVKNKELCLRYNAIKIDNIKNNKTPLDMKIFLNYTGMRSISLLVDITNYIMLELGQPMHAFDSRVVSDIEIDNAKDNDTFVTLDGVERKLTKENLMIKNKNEYFAVAGVMGGLDSEILEDTNSIMLESATFDATSVRKTATSLGLRTEASARYEKALDPNMTSIAIKRFAKLLHDENPDMEIASNLTDIYPQPLNEGNIKLTKTKLNKYMGKELEDSLVKDILEALDFKVTVNKDSYDVVVPTYRCTKDVTLEADLIEEIARMYGYENFAMEPLKLDLTFKQHENIFETEYSIKRFLTTKYNLSEVHTYLWNKTSLLNSTGINKENVKLLGKVEDNILRDDLCLSLLETAKNNLKNTDKIGIYEIGTEIRDNTDCRSLSVLLVDEESNVENIYYEAKEIVYSLFKTIKNIDIKLIKHESYDYYIKDYSYGIYANDTLVGHINIFNSKVSKAIAKKKAFVSINIDFTTFLTIDKNEVLYHDISKYPVTTLDYTIIVGKEDKYEILENILDEFKSPIINKVELIDTYLDNYEKRFTIRYTVGSQDNTLTAEELSDFKDKFIKHIKNNKLGIVE